MEFGLTKALRNMRICIDSGFRAETHKAKFTIGTSRIKCIETRRATNEIGGFAQHAYVAVDDLVIVNRTHRFSLRRNKKETANCFVSATELCIALSKADAGVMEIVGEEDAEWHYPCVTFSETEDPRVVRDGDALFTEPAEILQISAECRLLGDRIEMTNVHVLHESLFEMQEENINVL